METSDASKAQPENIDDLTNGDNDKSCFIVESSTSVVEILDSDLEVTAGDVVDLSSPDLSESVVTISDTPASEVTVELSNFDVIDEVGSQETNPESDVAVNGSESNSQKFCAPDPVDLNKTPIAEPAETKQLIDIKFLNRRTYLAFQEEFITLIKTYYKSKLDDLEISDDMVNSRIRVTEKRVKKSDAFLIDTTPAKETIAISTPTYRKSFGNTILTGDKEVESPKTSHGQSRASHSCFNCGKDSHSLRDCPDPRNMKKINKARNEFGKRELRYHDDGENEFAHLVPGMISDELRAALGLTPSQIPLHVYKMRNFGYPPGWVEEAKIHNSGLSMFVDKDKKQLTPGEDEGEADVSNFKFDIQKIYDFPGFNVVPNHQYVDLHKVYNLPPMQMHHSKELLIQSLGEDIVNGYKKTKIKDPTVVVDTTSHEAADMDLVDEDEEPPLPVSDSRPPEPMEDGEISNDSSRSRSPDEDELQAKRQKLMAEIENSANTPTTAAATGNNHIDATIIENSENENRDNIAKDIETGHVDTTVLGCPVLPSFSPFDNLPAGENFQVGVSDVINFENLAESTGKYERMKELIKKVRKFQKKHQQE